MNVSSASNSFSYLIFTKTVNNMKFLVIFALAFTAILAQHSSHYIGSKTVLGERHQNQLPAASPRNLSPVQQSFIPQQHPNYGFGQHMFAPQAYSFGQAFAYGR